MAFLVVKELGAETTVPISDPEVTIGRSRQNGVKLLTEQASRVHCRLLRTEKGGYKLVDGNSSNGTYVNGQRIARVALEDGCEVRFGQASFVYRGGRRENAEDAEKKTRNSRKS
jgi:pSer/pThr/pTyr-binding forkhead associated (FHA) protein